jgi:hypothetical protein
MWSVVEGCNPSTHLLVILQRYYNDARSNYQHLKLIRYSSSCWPSVSEDLIFVATECSYSIVHDHGTLVQPATFPIRVGKCPVRIPVEKPGTLNEGLCSFFQCIHSNSGINPQIRPRLLSLKSPHIHYPLVSHCAFSAL